MVHFQAQPTQYDTTIWTLGSVLQKNETSLISGSLMARNHQKGQQHVQQQPPSG